MRPQILAILIAAGLLAHNQRSAIAAQGARTLPAPDPIDAHLDLEYAKVGDVSLKLDLYVPRGARGKLPLIVAIHGGAWMGGDKRHVPMISFAHHGYAVASVEYRFSQVAKWPAQIEDCKAAVRWLRAHAQEYHLDPDHFGAWGDSAGGHLVALLGTTDGVKELEGDEGNARFSSRVQAVCDWYGPADFLTINQQAPPDTAIHHNAPDSPESKLLGGPIPENQEKARQASPVTYVSKDDAPFLIMHGDQDKLVPLGQSEELRDALQKAGVAVELHVVKGAGHGFPRDPKLFQMMQNFFDKHLKAGLPGTPSR